MFKTGALWDSKLTLAVGLILKTIAHCNLPFSCDRRLRYGCHPKLDLGRIKRWVSEFSDALEMPEIMHDLETIIVKTRKRKR